jgi:hypothetical protein
MSRLLPRRPLFLAHSYWEVLEVLWLRDNFEPEPTGPEMQVLRGHRRLPYLSRNRTSDAAPDRRFRLALQIATEIALSSKQSIPPYTMWPYGRFATYQDLRWGMDLCGV